MNKFSDLAVEVGGGTRTGIVIAIVNGFKVQVTEPMRMALYRAPVFTGRRNVPLDAQHALGRATLAMQETHRQECNDEWSMILAQQNTAIYRIVAGLGHSRSMPRGVALARESMAMLADTVRETIALHACLCEQTMQAAGCIAIEMAVRCATGVEEPRELTAHKMRAAIAACVVTACNAPDGLRKEALSLANTAASVLTLLGDGASIVDMRT